MFLEQNHHIRMITWETHSTKALSNRHCKQNVFQHSPYSPYSKKTISLCVCVYSRRNSFCMDESFPESSLPHLPAISASKSPLLPLMHSHPLSFKGSPFLILSGTLCTDSLQHLNIYGTNKCYRSRNLTTCHLRSCWRGSNGVFPDSFCLRPNANTQHMSPVCGVHQSAQDIGSVFGGLSACERADWVEDNPHVDVFLLGWMRVTVYNQR